MDEYISRIVDDVKNAIDRGIERETAINKSIDYAIHAMRTDDLAEEFKKLIIDQKVDVFEIKNRLGKYYLDEVNAIIEAGVK